jgi:hypothetical protein
VKIWFGDGFRIGEFMHLTRSQMEQTDVIVLQEIREDGVYTIDSEPDFCTHEERLKIHEVSFFDKTVYFACYSNRTCAFSEIAEKILDRVSRYRSQGIKRGFDVFQKNTRFLCWERTPLPFSADSAM